RQRKRHRARAAADANLVGGSRQAGYAGVVQGHAAAERDRAATREARTGGYRHSAVLELAVSRLPGDLCKRGVSALRAARAVASVEAEDAGIADGVEIGRAHV